MHIDVRLPLAGAAAAGAAGAAAASVVRRKIGLEKKVNYHKFFLF